MCGTAHITVKQSGLQAHFMIAEIQQIDVCLVKLPSKGSGVCKLRFCSKRLQLLCERTCRHTSPSSCFSGNVVSFVAEGILLKSCLTPRKARLELQVPSNHLIK